MPIDFEKLNFSARFFEGEHDFKAFCAAGSQVKTTVRNIYQICVKSEVNRSSRDIEIYVTGNGFLYNMVRTLAGTMLYFAAGRLSEQKLERTISECDRECVGKTMPAKGLTLECVDYGFKLFDV
jgi:tRNA pseudouridine38-40 synthase